MGDNIKDHLKPGVADWYKGKTLFEVLNDAELPKRETDVDLRMPVIDRMKEQNLIYLFGKIEQGIIREKQVCTLRPSNRLIKVESILNNDDQKIMYALPGENIKVGVKGIEEEDFERGMMLCNN